MSNTTAYILLVVATVIAWLLAFVETQYQLYLAPSELVGYWLAALLATTILVLVTKEMSRQVRVTSC